MKGDFTRRTFRSGNHYRGVLLQQGRVALDADWNEQLDIQLHLDETTARDAIGVHGAPRDAAGFAVTTRDGGRPERAEDAELTLSAGRYYVGGVLCENDEPVPLANQPDLPRVPLPTTDGRYLAYLDVWREHLTALEHPELREVALGGPDTGTRSRTVWQVRLEPVDADTTPDALARWIPRDSGPAGRLQARVGPAPADPAPSLLPTWAGYRRLENQLYRVEIHAGGDCPSFVWSRDNGSVAARLVLPATDPATVLTLREPCPDERLGFAKGDWVEVSDLARARRGDPGFLARLDEVDGTRLRIAEWLATAPEAPDLSDPAVVRRWDSAGALPVTSDWVDLEDGVQVRFEAGARYRTGDHWLIPARTAALPGADAAADLVGTIEWPRDADGQPRYRSPDGIEHHSAPVALLDRAGGLWTRIHDCRAQFAPLAEARPATWPGLHVEQVLLRRSETELHNDTDILLDDLVDGITVRFDGPVATALTGRQVLTVTADLPYPLSTAERTDWGLPDGAFLGTRPVTLDGEVRIEDRRLTWQPGAQVRGALAGLYSRWHTDRLSCRLTVNGRAVVHAQQPDRILNGLAPGRVRPEDGGTGLGLPTVDDVRGADFHWWFRLGLVPVPADTVSDDSEASDDFEITDDRSWDWTPD